jgi:hypothetical protein
MTTPARHQRPHARSPGADTTSRTLSDPRPSPPSPSKPCLEPLSRPDQRCRLPASSPSATPTPMVVQTKTERPEHPRHDRSTITWRPPARRSTTQTSPGAHGATKPKPTPARPEALTPITVQIRGSEVGSVPWRLPHECESGAWRLLRSRSVVAPTRFATASASPWQSSLGVVAVARGRALGFIRAAPRPARGQSSRQARGGTARPASPAPVAAREPGSTGRTAVRPAWSAERRRMPQSRRRE